MTSTTCWVISPLSSRTLSASVWYVVCNDTIRLETAQSQGGELLGVWYLTGSGGSVQGVVARVWCGTIHHVELVTLNM